MSADTTAKPPVGVLVIVSGPQYRAGSHRQFVLLARALAAANYPVLRFDYRGMGDSSGVQRDFNSVSVDVAAAIDAMQQHVPTVQQVVLWGLCDGAAAALLYCDDTHDKRVAGLCLLNPWVRSEASLARAHVKHYYADRLKQKEFWTKLLSGKVAAAALAGLRNNLRLAIGKPGSAAADTEPVFQQRMARAWRQFAGPILLLLSGNDYTAKEFLEFAGGNPAWAGLLAGKSVTRHDLTQADHTFSNADARQQVGGLTQAWLQTCVGR